MFEFLIVVLIIGAIVAVALHTGAGSATEDSSPEVSVDPMDSDFSSEDVQDMVLEKGQPQGGRRFNIAVVGVSFGSRQQVIHDFFLHGGGNLRLKREPDNPVDPNAIGVYLDGKSAGHLPREDAEDIAPVLDAGGHIAIDRFFPVGGGPDKYWGLRLKIRVLSPEEVKKNSQ